MGFLLDNMQHDRMQNKTATAIMIPPIIPTVLMFSGENGSAAILPREPELDSDEELESSLELPLDEPDTVGVGAADSPSHENLLP